MTIWWVLLLFLLSCKLIACSWERSAVLVSILLSAWSYKLTGRAKKSSIAQKGKGVWQCQELYVAHALRNKDCRQVHTVKQSCSGTGVVPVPSTQKTRSFASQSHEGIVILHGFRAMMCCCDLLSGFSAAVGCVLMVCPATTGILFVFFAWKLFLQLLQEENWECGLLKKWSNVTSVAVKSQTLKPFLLWWFAFSWIRRLLHFCLACSLRPFIYNLSFLCHSSSALTPEGQLE